jgi:murein DD-endopeptidase MepM/ murein hydrolase activator NlpD
VTSAGPSSISYCGVDHGNGEFSALLHMKTGSIRVKVGDKVRQGQIIGNLGFSGDAFLPHLHYMVMNGAVESKAEGLPSYFNDFRRFLGSRIEPVKHGQIDTGDIVETSVR